MKHSTFAAAATGLLGAATVAAPLALRLRTARHTTTHDAMTGLRNRAGFTRAAARLTRHSGGPARFVVMADCNRFKAVNDTFGHAAGDAVLVALAGRMGRLVAETGVAARFGGDEFALICTAEQLAAIGAGVLAVALHDQTGTAVADCTMAAGAAALDPERPLGVLLGQADAASYRAKATGQPLCLFDPAADDRPAAQPGAHPRIRIRDLNRWSIDAAVAADAAGKAMAR